jgi:hypothetical protein
MITTTILWPEKMRDGFLVGLPSEEERQLLDSKAEDLAPEFDTDQTYLREEGLPGTGIRKWPTQEIAQAYVDYVVANFDVVSATVDIE